MKKILFNRRFMGILLSLVFINTWAIQHAQPILHQNLQKELDHLEDSYNGKLGIYAINTANHEVIEHHEKQRFPFQSTFKVMVVSSVLKQAMSDPNLMQQKIRYTKDDLVFWSPITERHVESGMTIQELCAASIQYSDNTATDLLMKQLGGPKSVTGFARSIGDNTFNVESWEPNLNSNPKIKRDTTTPYAMEESLQKLAFGKVLSKTSQRQLLTWMKGNTTGDARIRAGVPKGWVVADKTGSGDDYGIVNDIGIIWPPQGKPIIVVIYFVGNQKDTLRQDAVVASATRLIVQELSK